MWKVEGNKIIIDKELTIVDSEGEQVTGRLELSIDESLLFAWLSKVDLKTLMSKFNIPSSLISIIRILVGNKKGDKK